MPGQATAETVVISMHMEKCGGTSLDRLLRATYGKAFFLYDPGPPEAHREPEFPPGTRCVHGHMFHGLHEYFPNRDCRYITLLRDPVERFLSNFDHLCRFEHPLHSMVTGGNGIERFCTSDEARHYRNLFVRRLSGQWEEVEASDLERAEEVLRGFAVVGVLEESGAFVRACARIFGWGADRLERHNAARDSRPLLSGMSATQRQLILGKNRWDIELMSRIQDLIAR